MSEENTIVSDAQDTAMELVNKRSTDDETAQSNKVENMDVEQNGDTAIESVDTTQQQDGVKDIASGKSVKADGETVTTKGISEYSNIASAETTVSKKVLDGNIADDSECSTPSTVLMNSQETVNESTADETGEHLNETLRTDERSSTDNEEEKTDLDLPVPLFEQPIEVQGRRCRKPVQFFQVSHPVKKRSDQAINIQPGLGTKLKDIPWIAENIDYPKDQDNVKALHKFLFGRSGDTDSRISNILEFSGINGAENIAKVDKMRAQLERTSIARIKGMFRVINFNLSGEKEELCNRIMEFLQNPNNDDMFKQYNTPPQKQTRSLTSTSSPKNSPNTPSKSGRNLKRKLSDDPNVQLRVTRSRASSSSLISTDDQEETQPDSSAAEVCTTPTSSSSIHAHLDTSVTKKGSYGRRLNISGEQIKETENIDDAEADADKMVREDGDIDTDYEKSAERSVIRELNSNDNQSSDEPPATNNTVLEKPDEPLDNDVGSEDPKETTNDTLMEPEGPLENDTGFKVAEVPIENDTEFKAAKSLVENDAAFKATESPVDNDT